MNNLESSYVCNALVPDMARGSWIRGHTGASQKGGSKALWGGSNPWIELLYLLDQGYAVKLGWKEAEIIHCYL